MTDKLKKPPEIKELPFKEERSILYSQLKSGDKDKIIEAARHLFVKTSNPIYFYILLNNYEEAPKILDLFELLKGCSNKPLAHYLAGSYWIKKNSLKDANSEFLIVDQELKSTKNNLDKVLASQLPIFRLISEKSGLAFTPKLINLQTAAQNNIKLLKPYLNKKSNIIFYDITLEQLNQLEIAYNKINSYSGISIEEFLRIDVKILPSGLANNIFILNPKDNRNPLIIPFKGAAITKRALLLFLMRIRATYQDLDKDEDDVFYKPEIYKNTYKEALSFIGDDREGELSFQTSSEWWGIHGYKNRKTYVSRINDVFKQHKVIGQVIVPCPRGSNGSYLLVSHLRACFVPSHY